MWDAARALNFPMPARVRGVFQLTSHFLCKLLISKMKYDFLEKVFKRKFKMYTYFLALYPWQQFKNTV